MSLSQGPESPSRFLEQLNEMDSGLRCIHVGDTDTTIFGFILETRGTFSSMVGLIIAEDDAGRYDHIELDYGLLERRTSRII